VQHDSTPDSVPRPEWLSDDREWAALDVEIRRTFDALTSRWGLRLLSDRFITERLAELAHRAYVHGTIAASDARPEVEPFLDGLDSSRTPGTHDDRP
jgi:hypothetical protein